MMDPNHLAAKAIVDLVADHFGIPVGDVLGPRRNPPLPLARAIAAAIMYDLLRGMTTTSIAHYFNGRTHNFTLRSVEICKNTETYARLRQRALNMPAVERLR